MDFAERGVIIRSTRSRQLRLQNSLFSDGEWSHRRYLLWFLGNIFIKLSSGIDRVFILDHQIFSGFFKYEIVNDKMTIEYYAINDLEYFTKLDRLNLFNRIIESLVTPCVSYFEFQEAKNYFLRSC